jgi:hypothetical protein
MHTYCSGIEAKPFTERFLYEYAFTPKRSIIRLYSLISTYGSKLSRYCMGSLEIAILSEFLCVLRSQTCFNSSTEGGIFHVSG